MNWRMRKKKLKKIVQNREKNFFSFFWASFMCGKTLMKIGPGKYVRIGNNKVDTHQSKEFENNI